MCGVVIPPFRFLNKKSFFFYLFTFGLMLCVLGPSLWSDGMFFDGITYAVMARNLAEGLGSFWAPHFSETIMTQFLGHLPLSIGLQSLFFKLFGDGHFTERIYSLTTFLIVSGLLIAIWKRVGTRSASDSGWVPLILWGLVPLVYWSYSNNMLENTTSIFTTLSVALAIRGVSERQRSLWLLGAGGSIALAFFCKGIVALFPLAVPLLHQVAYRRQLRFDWASQTAWLLAGALLPTALLILISDSALQNVQVHLKQMVLSGILHGQTVSTRWYILGRLLRELTPMLLVTGVLMWTFRRKKPDHAMVRTALFFFMVGASASLPIMVTLKQSGFYLVPSFPFFALACAALVGPFIEDRIRAIDLKSVGMRLFQGISLCTGLAAVLISVYSMGRIGRDHDRLVTAYSLKEVIPKQTSINVCPSMHTDWPLHSYLARYARLSIELDVGVQHAFLLSNGSCVPLDSLVTSLELPSTYSLYRQAP